MSTAVPRRMYRVLSLVLVVGCTEIPTEVPVQGELVITELDLLDGPIHLDVTGDTIRWTSSSNEGWQLRAASLGQHAILAGDVPPFGTTQANLLVDGDTVYVTDYVSIMALTDGDTAQVIKDDFVSRLALDDDHELVWGHTGYVSWLDGGIANVGIATISHVEDLAVAGEQIYASTRTVRANGLVYGSLYRIDRATRTPTLVAPASTFQHEFEDVSDQYVGCGVYAVAGRVFWCVEGEQGLEGGPRKLLAEVTPHGLEIVLPPQHATGRFVPHAGSFYWTTAEDGTPLWGLRPGDAPLRLRTESGIGVVEAIADGYLYGVQASPFPGELQVRRVPIP